MIQKIASEGCYINTRLRESSVVATALRGRFDENGLRMSRWSIPDLKTLVQQFSSSEARTKAY